MSLPRKHESRRRVLLAAAVCCLVLGVLPPPAWAQEDEARSSIEIPRFFFEALSFSSDQPGMSRLDVYVEVPYNVLTFTRHDETFDARYEVTLSITDSANNQVTEKFWEQTIQARDYASSVSAKSSRIDQRSFSLAPATYTISVQVRDGETKKTSTNRRKVIVRNYSSRSPDVSDLMLVNRLDLEGEKKVVYPNISGNVGDVSGGFYLFFEAYDTTAVDTVRFVIDVRNLQGAVLWSDSVGVRFAAEKKSCTPKVSASDLPAGDYFVEVRAEPAAAPRDTTVRPSGGFSSHPFVIRWAGMPVSPKDLDKAIDQMQYLSEKTKVDEMKKATPEKKQQLFREVWKKRDPTPETERNEAMEEYYARVEYANKNFSHYVEGWKTDMGMVYIIFGAPSNIERHPFEIDSKPYEIWSYYGLNRDFIFVDVTGFGDYRLQSPIWDIWPTRPR